ncbi:hypothetical protein [Streptomyces sp. NPDC058678]|uniref:hypothetical protein n=1 Tax=Streptomyces sp. NPDC058678 TaxID=3346595 RepID=UPI0036536C80
MQEHIAHEVQCERVRALAPERLLRPIGSVPRQRTTEIDAALRRHLALRAREGAPTGIGGRPCFVRRGVSP